jgi:hypothetical protein
MEDEHEDIIDRDLTRHFVPQTLDEAKYVIEQQQIYMGLLFVAITYGKNVMIFKEDEVYSQFIRYMDIKLTIKGEPPKKEKG